MIIKQTVVTEKEIDLRFDTANSLYVEFEEYPEHADYIGNPFAGTEVSYHLPYNWTDSADFGTGSIEELLKEGLDNAPIEEQKAFFDKWIADLMDDPENALEDNLLSMLIDEYAQYGEDYEGDYLQAVANIINLYTESKVYPIDVTTHSYSTFSLGNSFNDAYLIAPQAMDTITVEYLLNAFTDWFNGFVYAYVAYDTLENAINQENSVAVTVFEDDMYEWEAGLISDFAK